MLAHTLGTPAVLFGPAVALSVDQAGAPIGLTPEQARISSRAATAPSPAVLAAVIRPARRRHPTPPLGPRSRRVRPLNGSSGHRAKEPARKPAQLSTDPQRLDPGRANMGTMDGEIEDSPNCPVCLHPLETAGPDDRPHWVCSRCGWTGLSR